MTSLYASAVVLGQGQGFSSQPMQKFITDNIVPLVLLVIAVILLWIGGKGDNAGVARRSLALVVGLAVLGIAVSQKAGDLGKFFASLIVG
ncbi:MAG: hypothetical protein H0V92_08240 [Pseudonocardiales bacterium]|nr:hypothetical protein [Pseudonocardiales bacterium]